MPSRSPTASYDSPWKLALTHALRAFMQFYFAAISAMIDWSRPPRFLDKELAQAGFGDTPAGRVADKLVAVYLRDGSEHWVLVHIEVQAQRDEGLPRRVLAYNYRIFEQFGRPVASLVVLADEDVHWLPHCFYNDLLGTVMGISFATAKLLDYADRMDELRASHNPFALLTLAHLHTQDTRDDAQRRYAFKWQLTKLLFQHGWSKKRIINLFKAINWMMTLPAELESRYWRSIRHLEEERNMEWISSMEQMLIDKGVKRGLERGLERGRAEGASLVLQELLAHRFGALSQATLRKLERASLAQLTAWSRAALEAESLKQVFAVTELSKTH